MVQVVARHLLDARMFEDAVSVVWHARHVDRSTQRATIRTVDLSRDALLTPGIGAFLAEARMAAALVHRNVVRAFEIGDAGQPYVISRHTRAVTWSAHVRDGIGVTAAIHLLAPLASALDAAADAGVPHGAVHPRSIWVDDGASRAGGARAVISGFGLHHLLSIMAARDAGGRSLDDFLYVAPELLRGAAPTNRSDQYSLAAALQHAVTGRPPFARSHASALFGAHLFGRRTALDAGASDPRSAAELDHIVGRAMARDPGERFASCEDFMAAVADWHAATTGVPAGRRAVAAAPPQPTPLPAQVDAHDGRVSKRLPARTAAIAAAAAAVGLLAVFWLARGPLTAGAELAASQVPTAPAAAGSDGRSADLSVRWRTRLPSQLVDLQLTSEGPVAVTSESVLLVDPATGDVRTDLSSGAPDGAVAAGDRIVSADGSDVQAVSAVDGSVLWRAPVRIDVPTVAGDTVYGVTDQDVPQLVATDAASGDRLWEFPRDEAAFPADAVVAAVDDFVYLADGSALYGILPEGAMAGEDTPLITATEAAREPLCLWRHVVEEDMWTSSLRAADRGVVVANRSGSVCLRRHSDGAPLWCVDVVGVARAEPTIHPTDGRVIVVTEIGATAIDTRTGARIWSREGAWRRSAMADDQLIAVDADGRVAAMSVATGALTRPVDTAVGAPSALAVDGDTLYVGHRDGTLTSVMLTRTRT